MVFLSKRHSEFCIAIYDQENIRKHQSVASLCLQRSFWGFIQNLATERSSLDFRILVHVSDSKGEGPLQRMNHLFFSSRHLPSPSWHLHLRILVKPLAEMAPAVYVREARTRIFQNTEIVTQVNQVACCFTSFYIECPKLLDWFGFPEKRSLSLRICKVAKNAIWNTKHKKYRHEHGELSCPKLTAWHSPLSTPKLSVAGNGWQQTNSHPCQVCSWFDPYEECQQKLPSIICANMCSLCMAVAMKNTLNISRGKCSKHRSLQFLSAHSTDWQRGREVAVIGIRCCTGGSSRWLHRISAATQDFTVGA